MEKKIYWTAIVTAQNAYLNRKPSEKNTIVFHWNNGSRMTEAEAHSWIKNSKPYEGKVVGYYLIPAEEFNENFSKYCEYRKYRKLTMD